MSKVPITSDTPASSSGLLIYQAQDGTIKIDVRLEDETVWLTQEDMAQLFGKAKSTINEHIKNIFVEGELQESDVTKKFGISEFQQKPLISTTLTWLFLLVTGSASWIEWVTVCLPANGITP